MRMDSQSKKEYMKRWREKNKAHIAEYNKKYFDENPEYRQQYRDKNRKRINEKKLFYIKRNREEYLKKNGPCAMCGSWERLELDHIDPSTKIDNVYWHWNKEKRETEAAKCQVLCHLCHRLKTHAERGWTMHGAILYRKGCRCDVCTKTHEKLLKRRERENARKNP